MPEARRDARWLPLLLFAATCATTTWAGGQAPGGAFDWNAGLAFSATLMSILVAHEMGHYVVARRHGVAASLPHFVPLPPPFFLGTLGAVITMRTDRAGRNALLDIGAAGPIAGFVVATPLMALGAALSPVIRLEPTGAVSMLGDSLLSAGLMAWFGPHAGPGEEVLAHPVLIGAWAGYLVTAINLLPMGQLDGGHVLYAFAPAAASRWARRVYRLAIALGVLGLLVHGPTILWAALPAVGLEPSSILAPALFERLAPLYRWSSYAFFVWALLGRFTGLAHPPLADPAEPLTGGRRAVAALCLLIFALTFMPSPMWIDRIWLVQNG